MQYVPQVLKTELSHKRKKGIIFWKNKKAGVFFLS